MVKYQLWYWSHLLFHGAIITAAAGVRSLIRATITDSAFVNLTKTDPASVQSAEYVFCISTALIFLSLCIFGFVNQESENLLVSKRVRLGMRGFVAAFCFCLPFFSAHSTWLHAETVLVAVALVATTCGVIEQVGGVPPLEHRAWLQQQVVHMNLPQKKKHRSTHAGSKMELELASPRESIALGPVVGSPLNSPRGSIDAELPRSPSSMLILHDRRHGSFRDQ